MSVTQMYEKQIAALKEEVASLQNEKDALRIELGEVRQELNDFLEQTGVTEPESDDTITDDDLPF